LGTRVPKKGLGGPCAWEDALLSAGLAFGDAADEDVPFALGDPLGGEIDLAVGLKDDAFTFRRFIAVGESGLFAPDGATALARTPPTLADGGTEGVADERLPLNGGMGGMTMLILFWASDVLVPAADFCAPTFMVEAFTAAGWAAGGLADPGTLLAIPPGARLTTGEVPAVAAVPMARACEDSASLVDFSRICLCFSSSFARMGTRSSGIGLLSLKL